MANVLLVEDEADLRGLFRRWLESAGHTVQEASTGEGALRMVESSPCDLVLLDLLLPGIGGSDVARRIAELPERNRVPVVMITMVDREQHHADVPVSAWVVKPLASRELLATVEQALRGAEG